MGAIYGMQRANGDWFVHGVNGRLSLPLFRTVHDALMSRLRNFGMLLFKPVNLDFRLLKQLVSESGKDVDFCMIDDPFVSLERGEIVERAQLLNLTQSHLEKRRLEII